MITDAPVDNQGKGEGFSPTDSCATSLATCMLTTMAIWGEPKGVVFEGATAEVEKKWQRIQEELLPFVFS